MSESLTGEPVATPASNEPTGQEQQQPTAESTQETISTEQSNQSNESTSQEAVSTDTAQTQNNSGVAVDDGLAKFAKSQGIEDLNSLSDREKNLLKIASDNQKAYRSSQNTPKIADTVKELTKPADDADDNEKFRSEFNQFRYEQKTSSFWADEKRSKELEPTMVQILNEKKEQFGDEYARNLSNDLETLYGMAQLKTGNTSGPIVDENKIRQEERDSINKQLTSGAPQAHAVAQSTGTPKIDSDWIENTYEPGNAEHEKMLQEAMAAQRSEQY